MTIHVANNLQPVDADRMSLFQKQLADQEIAKLTLAETQRKYKQQAQEDQYKLADLQQAAAMKQQIGQYAGNASTPQAPVSFNPASIMPGGLPVLPQMTGVPDVNVPMPKRTPNPDEMLDFVMKKMAVHNPEAYMKLVEMRQIKDQANQGKEMAANIQKQIAQGKREDANKKLQLSFLELAVKNPAHGDIMLNSPMFAQSGMDPIIFKAIVEDEKARATNKPATSLQGVIAMALQSGNEDLYNKAMVAMNDYNGVLSKYKIQGIETQNQGRLEGIGLQNQGRLDNTNLQGTNTLYNTALQGENRERVAEINTQGRMDVANVNNLNREQIANMKDETDKEKNAIALKRVEAYVSLVADKTKDTPIEYSTAPNGDTIVRFGKKIFPLRLKTPNEREEWKAAYDHFVETGDDTALTGIVGYLEAKQRPQNNILRDVPGMNPSMINPANGQSFPVLDNQNMPLPSKPLVAPTSKNKELAFPVGGLPTEEVKAALANYYPNSGLVMGYDRENQKQTILNSEGVRMDDVEMEIANRIKQETKQKISQSGKVNKLAVALGDKPLSGPAREKYVVALGQIDSLDEMLSIPGLREGAFTGPIDNWEQEILKKTGDAKDAAKLTTGLALLRAGIQQLFFGKSLTQNEKDTLDDIAKTFKSMKYSSSNEFYNSMTKLRDLFEKKNLDVLKLEKTTVNDLVKEAQEKIQNRASGTAEVGLKKIFGLEGF